MGRDLTIFVERRIGFDARGDVWDVVEDPLGECDCTGSAASSPRAEGYRPGWRFSPRWQKRTREYLEEEMAKGDSGDSARVKCLRRELASTTDDDPWEPCDDCNPFFPLAVPRTSAFAGAGKGHRSFYDDPGRGTIGVLITAAPGLVSRRTDEVFPFRPLGQARGLPRDLSPLLLWHLHRGWEIVRKDDLPRYIEYSDTFLRDATPAWVLLSEVLEYDWTTPYDISDLLLPSEYMEFKSRPPATTWDESPWRYMRHVRNSRVTFTEISNGEMEEQIARGQMETVVSGELTEGSHLATRLHWQESPWDRGFERFLEVVHHDLVPLGDPEDTRLVMWAW